MDFRQPHSYTNKRGICEGNIYTKLTQLVQTNNELTHQIKSMYLGTSYVIEPAGHPLNSFAYCGYIYVLKSGLDWITAISSKVHTRPSTHLQELWA